MLKLVQLFLFNFKEPNFYFQRKMLKLKNSIREWLQLYELDACLCMNCFIKAYDTFAK